MKTLTSGSRPLPRSSSADDARATASPICASAFATCRALASCHLERLGQPIAVGQAPRVGARPRASSSRARRQAAACRASTSSVRPRCLWPSRSRSSAASNKVRRSTRFQSFQVPGPTARMSTTVRISSSRSRSGLCTCADEILDRLGIGEVALERGRGHQQMMADQPGDGLGLGGVEAEARAELQRDLGADDAVVAAAALGDVVQQHRDIERPARRDLPEQRGRQRMVVRQLAALDRREQADRPDRMLVDRIMVVHVELHLRDDPAEVGHEAAEHAGLIHPAQHQVGRIEAGQHVQEQARWRAGRRGPARRSACASRVAARIAVGMDLQLLARRQREQLDQPHRVLRRKNRRSGSTGARGRA